ncbi:glycosyltransferase family 2 protein [Candidatus Woesebacteria bacterium]|nr:MAG: glycosyltransferase family 2 protein [Candidatus Woesebacteria bacterium]
MKRKTYLIDELSVFFPAYNEEAQIEKTVASAIKILKNTAKKWEVLIINDGSKDNTLQKAEKIALKERSVRVINHKQNRGYGAAIKSGFYNAKYDWIAFTDADGQFDFAEIDKFVETQKQTKADLVIGYYLDRKVSFFRKLNTTAWETVVFILFGLRVKDIDCGFKLISKKVVTHIPKLESERGAFISSEFLIKARKNGFKIVEIGVHHYPRVTGKGTGADINVIIKSFIDLFTLWRKIK